MLKHIKTFNLQTKVKMAGLISPDFIKLLNCSGLNGKLGAMKTT